MTLFVQDGWTPTGMLRFIERLEYEEGDVGHPVIRRILQQLWACVDGPNKAEWRDVPLVSTESCEGKTKV